QVTGANLLRNISIGRKPRDHGGNPYAVFQSDAIDCDRRKEKRLVDTGQANVPGRSGLQQLVGDDFLLYLGRSFVHAERANLTVEALDHATLYHARAAVNL